MGSKRESSVRSLSGPRRWRLASLLFLGVAGVAIPGSEAWACVPQPLVTVTPKASGPPGTEFTVNGYAIAGRAEVRWNALDGPLLASADGPVFSTTVTVPEVAEGLYSVLVLERSADGGLGSTGRASFEVTAVPPTAPLTGNEGPPSTASGASGVPAGSSIPTGTAAAGAVGLLAVGGIGGAVLARRRGPRALRPDHRRTEDCTRV